MSFSNNGENDNSNINVNPYEKHTNRIPPQQNNYFNGSACGYQGQNTVNPQQIPYAPYNQAQYPYGNTYIMPTVAKKDRKTFSKDEKIFALISLFLGYLFIKFVCAGFLGASATVFFAVLFIVGLLFIKRKGIEISNLKALSLCVIIIFSFNFFISSSGLIKFLDFIFVSVASLWWLYSVGRESGKIGKGFFYDILKSVFIVPFCCFGACPMALVKSSENNKNGKVHLVIIGLAITLPITIFVAALLVSGDVMFSKLFNFTIEDIFRETFVFIGQLVLGIPFAFYIFGAIYGRTTGKYDDILSEESRSKISASIKIANPIIIYSALTPLCLLYVFYFFSQLAYFMSAFQSLLPQGFGYAEYARKGFFELCVVAVINLVVIWASIVFSKRKNGVMANGVKIYTIILSLFTIMLIITALSKMIMYINANGFTSMRIYTSWFMILMALVFILIILKQIFNKFNFQKVFAVAFVIMFAVLSFSNIDALVAKYNVKWYQEGKIDWMGYSMLGSMDDSAVEYIIPLLDDESLDKNRLLGYMERRYRNYFDDVRKFNISSYAAHEKLKEYEDEFDSLYDRGGYYSNY